VRLMYPRVVDDDSGTWLPERFVEHERRRVLDGRTVAPACCRFSG